MSASGMRGAGGATAIEVSALVGVAAPTPADKPPLPGTQPVRPRFAELLRQNGGGDTAPAKAAPVPIATPSSVSEPQDSGEPAPAMLDAKAAPANAAKARAAAPKIAPAKAAVENTPRTSEKVESESDEASGAGRDRGAAPTLPAGGADPRFAALAADGARPIGAGSVEDGTDTAPDDRSGDALRRGTGHARAAATLDAASDRRASLVEASQAQALKAGADAGLPAALAGAGERGDTLGPHRAERAVDAFTASLAAASTARAAEPLPATAAAAGLTVATPIDAPEFAAALGVQVSALAKDGVQHAELHLNPTEMGPVSIHISLDGNAARVDFGADVAATRQAIERGLPELASALRDAGFTLAGGGVSPHAGGRSSENDAAFASRRGGDGAMPMAAAVAAGAGVVVRRVGAGGVDLYA